MPEISIIMPVYQAGELLSRSVGSVREQPFQDWELLLIDDGSTDASPELCRRYAEGDSRVRYLRQDRNQGVSAARNRGLEEARGKYLSFLDADDALVTDGGGTLGTLYGLCGEHHADAAACAHYNVTPDGAERVETLLPSGVYNEAAVREAFVLPLFAERLRVPFLNGFLWRFLLKADRVRRLGLSFYGPYLEDELFLLEYFSAPAGPGETGCLAVTDRPLYRYFQNPASATRHYMPDLEGVLDRFTARKAETGAAYGLDAAAPGWRDNTNWSNLLILIGNEYARGNPRTMRARQEAVKALCRRPDRAESIARLNPSGMGRAKQTVTRLVRGGHFTLLTLLYRLKNRM